MIIKLSNGQFIESDNGMIGIVFTEDEKLQALAMLQGESRVLLFCPPDMGDMDAMQKFVQDL